MSVKSDLRKELLSKRKCISDKAEKDRMICDKLINTQEYKNAELVLLYAALDDEINCDSVITYSIDHGKRVALPRCEDKNGNMSFYQIESFKDLETGNFSVREPKCYCKKVTDYSASICVVPGLSFDKSNFRIGYGKGYYDRFLKNYFYISIGLCYNDLVKEKIPTDQYDLPVDFVLTD